jgi:hypothetical protein
MTSTQVSAVQSKNLAKNAAIYIAAWPLVFYSLLVNQLRADDYPLLAPESLIRYAAAAACGVVVGGVYLASPRAIRAVIDGLLVALAVDLATDSSFWVVSLIWAVVSFGALALGRSLAPAIAFMATVTLGLTLAGVGKPPSPTTPPPLVSGTPNMPAIVHIILDEHAGIEGLPQENDASERLRSDLINAYNAMGFRLYGRAYAQHFHTVNSIPQIMNLGVNQPVTADHRDGVKLKSNAYFEGLRRLGYQLTIYETDFVDFCSLEPNKRCATYAADGLRELWRAPLATSDKSALISVFLLSRSELLWTGLNVYNRLAAKRGIPPIVLTQRGRLSSYHAQRAAGDFVKQLEKAQPGGAYFAHLVFPHYPYVVTSGCELKPFREWRDQHLTGGMRDREAAYFEQVRCATKIVERGVAAVERSPAGMNYIFIVHGDHGSRITTQVPRSDRSSSDRDLIASHSALFAVKGPNIQSGYVPDAATVSSLIRDLVDSHFTKPPRGDGTVDVYLADEEWVPKKAVRLPVDWLSGAKNAE